MNRFLVLSLCLSVGILADFSSSTDVNGLKNENYRLNTDVIPLDYIVDLTPYFETSPNGKEPFTFDGICTITVKASKSNVDRITLHKQFMEIVEQSLTTAPNRNQQVVGTVAIKSNEFNNITSKYTLILAAPLVKDKPYVLTFKYTGKLQTDYHGLFSVSYKEGNATK